MYIYSKLVRVVKVQESLSDTLQREYHVVCLAGVTQASERHVEDVDSNFNTSRDIHC